MPQATAAIEQAPEGRRESISGVSPRTLAIGDAHEHDPPKGVAGPCDDCTTTDASSHPLRSGMSFTLSDGVHRWIGTTESVDSGLWNHTPIDRRGSHEKTDRFYGFRISDSDGV